ncbi:hypothetical protein HRbin23_01397 [bacterium HR23]|nr:hypothetical protein HRbin23_01397 [bacterium HR23]
MPLARDALLREMHTAFQAVLRHLQGLDYALDWREGPEEWSARDIVDHLLGTEDSGILFHLGRALRGEPITPNPGHLSRSPQRRAMDIQALRRALTDTYQEVIRLVQEASPQQWERKVRLVRPQGVQEIDPEGVVRRFFIAHWNEHARQLASLQERLGIVMED